MNPEQLLAHFDRISDAPDAIPRLRRFILDLAVRGKLIEQDPKDEPASELVKRIQAEEARLRKEGEIRKQEQLPPVDAGSIPFLAPKYWTWLPLTRIGLLSGGMTPSKNRWEFWEGDINWFSPKDIKSDELVESELKITRTGVEETGLQLYPPGCLFIVARSGILKRTFPVSINRVKATVNQDLKVLKPFVEGLERYLQIMFRGMTDVILSTLVKTGTTVQSLKYEEFELQPFPLPPLAEQHRIVAKVEELMALCDRLDAAKAERESRRDRLAASSLHRLNNGTDPDGFRDHARFYFNQLPRLTTKPEHIQQLRKTILDLAVSGKLVPQDPNVVPVAIADIPLAKKSDGRVLDDNPEDNAGPYNIPESWRWYRLGAISQHITDGEHATPPRIIEQQVPLVTAKNVRNGFMDYDDTDWVSFETANKAWSRCRPAIGDILLVCVGATTGRLCVLHEARDMVLVRSVALIRPYKAIDVYYLALALRSPMCQTQIWGKVKVTAQPCLYIHRIKSLSIPIPPLAEQHRIVAKVDELMAICDKLEAQLTTTHTESRRLLEAVLHEALSGRNEHESVNR